MHIYFCQKSTLSIRRKHLARLTGRHLRPPFPSHHLLSLSMLAPFISRRASHALGQDRHYVGARDLVRSDSAYGHVTSGGEKHEIAFLTSCHPPYLTESTLNIHQNGEYSLVSLLRLQENAKKPTLQKGFEPQTRKTAFHKDGKGGLFGNYCMFVCQNRLLRTDVSNASWKQEPFVRPT